MIETTDDLAGDSQIEILNVIPLLKVFLHYTV